MAKKSDDKTEISKIKSAALSRGLSLMNMTVASGARFASLKLGDLFVDKEERKKRLEGFLGKQAGVLVEELGRLKGSVMKAGQMLSVYGEHFLPNEVNKVLKALQSESRPLEWSEIKKVLVRQLGEGRVAELEIEPKPVAAASMGQVYRARIKASGESIALKVQYPGVDKAIDSDLRALKSILSLSQLVPKGPSFDEILKEIRMMLHHEADYRREYAMIEQYQQWLKGDERFVVPKVYPAYSSKRVLAMSYEEGTGIDSAEVKGLSQSRRNGLGAALIDLFLQEVFVWRAVQTDPHFGNYKVRLVEAGDKIVLLDFGAVRKFPKKYIRAFAAMAHAALMRDPDGIRLAGTELGFLRDSDPDDVFDMFAGVCISAVEGFMPEFESPSLDASREGPNPYDWGNTDLIKRISNVAKNAVFTFKLRTPPREAVFLDRKMVGTYSCLTELKLRFGPRQLILKYLAPWLNDAADGANDEEDEDERFPLED